MALLLLFSFLGLSGNLMQLLKHEAGPSLVLTIDFLIVVLVNAKLLLLPHYAMRKVSVS